MNSLLDLIFLGDSGPKPAPTSLIDYDPAMSRKAGFAQGLMPLGLSMAMAGQRVDPTTRAKLIMGGVDAMGNTARGHVQADQQSAILGTQLAAAKRTEAQDKAWRAMMGLPDASGSSTTPAVPGTRTASAPSPTTGTDASPLNLGVPPGASMAMAGNERPGPTPAAAARLAAPPMPGAPGARVDMGAASPIAAIPPNMRPILAAMGPEKGAAFMGSVMAKSLDKGNWVRKDMEIDGKLIPGQVDTNTTSPNYGKWQALDPATTKVAVNPNINMPKVETEFDKHYGGELGKAAAAIFPEADRARDQLAVAQHMKNVVGAWKEGGGVQGWTGPLQAQVTQFAQGLGVDTSKGLAKGLGLADDAGPAQAMDALMRKMALGNIGAGGLPANNFSEADRNFIVDMQPNLKDTAQGFELKVYMAEKVASRSVEKEALWNDMQEKGKTYSDFRREWAKYTKANPLFSKEEMDNIRSVAGVKPTAPGGGGGEPPKPAFRYVPGQGLVPAQ